MLQAASTPALWTLQGSSLLPMCEHPHAPHPVAPTTAPLAVASLNAAHLGASHGMSEVEQGGVHEQAVSTGVQRRPATIHRAASGSVVRITGDDAAFLRRTALLAFVAGDDADDTQAPQTSTSDKQREREQTQRPRLCRLIDAHWGSLATKPLTAVADPGDSSQHLWLCPHHAAELTPPDSGNAFDYPHDFGLVDVGFLRWLRVGVALKVASQALAAFLGQRAEQWYTQKLQPVARQQVVMERMLAVSVEQAVPAGVTLAKPLTLVRCEQESPWLRHVMSYRSPDAAAMGAAMAEWQAVPSQARHVMSMKPLRTALAGSNSSSDVEEAMNAVLQAFVEQLSSEAAAQDVVTVKALPVKDAVLVAIQPCTTTTASASAADIDIQCDGSEESCTKLPGQSVRKCDLTKAACVTCRGWAKAIKSLHRKPKSLSDSSWRNCISQHWSNQVCMCVSSSERTQPSTVQLTLLLPHTDGHPLPSNTSMGCRQSLHVWRLGHSQQCSRD